MPLEASVIVGGAIVVAGDSSLDRRERAAGMRVPGPAR